MIRTIEQTITEDRLRIYKLKRAEFEEELNELEAERKRIVKRKKNKKEKMKMLKQNTRQQFCFIAKALNATVLHYKVMYYEMITIDSKSCLMFALLRRVSHL